MKEKKKSKAKFPISSKNEFVLLGRPSEKYAFLYDPSMIISVTDQNTISIKKEKNYDCICYISADLNDEEREKLSRIKENAKKGDHFHFLIFPNRRTAIKAYQKLLTEIYAQLILSVNCSINIGYINLDELLKAI